MRKLIREKFVHLKSHRKLGKKSTVVLRTNRTNPIFHTKLAFLIDFLGTKALENCLILLRVNQHVQGEHKLKFWLKNIHEFQSCSFPFAWFLMLPSKSQGYIRLALIIHLEIYLSIIAVACQTVWPIENNWKRLNFTTFSLLPG